MVNSSSSVLGYRNDPKRREPDFLGGYSASLTIALWDSTIFISLDRNNCDLYSGFCVRICLFLWG